MRNCVPERMRCPQTTPFSLKSPQKDKVSQPLNLSFFLLIFKLFTLFSFLAFSFPSWLFHGSWAASMTWPDLKRIGETFFLLDLSHPALWKEMIWKILKRIGSLKWNWMKMIWNNREIKWKDMIELEVAPGFYEVISGAFCSFHAVKKAGGYKGYSEKV